MAESRVADGTGAEQSVDWWSPAQLLAEPTTSGRRVRKEGGEGTGWGYPHTVLKLCVPAAIRGELADAEENWSEAQGSQGSWLADAEKDWSEAQGSQGSWQMQRKIGQWLRGARGATWLERFASLKADAVCAWIEGRSRVW